MGVAADESWRNDDAWYRDEEWWWMTDGEGVGLVVVGGGKGG